MTYTLFSFVFMLIYGSVVAVLAYKAGKYERDKLIRGAYKNDEPFYFYKSKVDSVMIDTDVDDIAIVSVGNCKYRMPISKNPWVSDFIKGASE